MIETITSALQLNVLSQLFADLEGQINSRSLNTVTWASISLIVLALFAAFANKRFPKLKAPLFTLIVTIMAGSTISLIASTVYLNIKSDSGGPVHWHADMEVWACGQELELRDPTGLSNKIGTPTLHEHDDHRIHLEGVVVDKRVDASIGKFMNVIGGGISDDSMAVPLNPAGMTHKEDETDGDAVDDTYNTSVEEHIVADGDKRTARFVSGEKCGDQKAEVQVFVYRMNEDEKTYSQYKLDDPGVQKYLGANSLEQFSIKETPNVPPGDCIIFEFDKSKSRTDRLCQQYGVRDQERCQQFGVEADKRSICELKEVPNPINGSSINENPKVECAITYDKNGKVESVSAPSGYDPKRPFNPEQDCTNYPKEEQN